MTHCLASGERVPLKYSGISSTNFSNGFQRRKGIPSRVGSSRKAYRQERSRYIWRTLSAWLRDAGGMRQTWMTPDTAKQWPFQSSKVSGRLLKIFLSVCELSTCNILDKISQDKLYLVMRYSVFSPVVRSSLPLQVNCKFRDRAINKFSETLLKNLWSYFITKDVLSIVMAWFGPYQKTFSINIQFHHTHCIYYSCNEFHFKSYSRQQAPHFERTDSLKADSKVEFTALRIF